MESNKRELLTVDVLRRKFDGIITDFKWNKRLRMWECQFIAGLAYYNDGEPVKTAQFEYGRKLRELYDKLLTGYVYDSREAEHLRVLAAEAKERKAREAAMEKRGEERLEIAGPLAMLFKSPIPRFIAPNGITGNTIKEFMGANHTEASIAEWKNSQMKKLAEQLEKLQSAMKSICEIDPKQLADEYAMNCCEVKVYLETGIWPGTQSDGTAGEGQDGK